MRLTVVSPRRTLAVAAALSLALLACGSDEDASDGDGGSGPLAVVKGPPSGDDALIEGELRIDGECVTLIEDGREWLIAWPSEGTVWDTETETIRYDDGETGDGEPEIVEMNDGDTVRFGGGGRDEIESGDDYEEPVASINWLQDPAEDCATSAIWFAG